MKTLVLYSVLLVFSLTSLANDTTSTANSDTELLTKLEAAKKIKTCVDQICGNTPDTVTSDLVKTAQIDASKDPFVQKFSQQLIKFTEKEVELDKSIKQDVKKWLKDARLVVNPALSRMVAIGEASRDLSKFTISMDENEKITVDAKKSRKLFAELSDEEFQEKLAVATILYDQYSSNNLGFGTIDPALVRARFPGKKFDEHVKKMAAEISNARQILEKSGLGVLYQYPGLMPNTDLVVKDLLTSNQVNPASLEQLDTAYFLVKLVGLAAEDGKLAKLIKPKPIQTDKWKDSTKLINQIDENMEESSKKLAQWKKEGVKDHPCVTARVRAQAILPNKNQVQNFKKQRQQAKKQFAKGASRYLSKTTNKNLKKLMDNVTLVPPMTKLGHQKLLSQASKQLEKEYKQYQDTMAKFRKDPKFRDEMLSLLLTFNEMDTSDSDKKNDPEIDDFIIKFCKSLIPRSVPDATYTRTGGIVVGPLSVRSWPLGKGIVHHELGHNFSSMLQKKDTSKQSKKWYDDTMACLRTQHTENGEQYQEEDFSDLMPTLVEPEAGNAECLLAKKGDNYDYLFDSMESVKGDTGVHSESFFRLLHTEFHLKGSYPKVCNEAVKALKQVPKFKKCGRENPTTSK